MKLNLKSLLSDVQIITNSTCEHKRTQRHYILSYFSADPLGEQRWCFILPLLSIQNVCGVGMSSEMCGERFTPLLPSGAVSQNLSAGTVPWPCQNSWGIGVV